MSDEGRRFDWPRVVVWGIVVVSLAGMWLASHVFVIWALDLLLMFTLAYVLAKADAGCKGWGAAFLGGFLGAAIPFALMVTLGDRFEPLMSRYGVDPLAFPLFVLMLVMPNAMILCGWLGAACARSLRKQDGKAQG